MGLIEVKEHSSVIQLNFFRHKPYYTNNESENLDHIIPYQVAYAVSIHKSQGLKYDSVKIVIVDDYEEMIIVIYFKQQSQEQKIFLTLYWSPEMCNRVLNKIKPNDNNDGYHPTKLKKGSFVNTINFNIVDLKHK